MADPTLRRLQAALRRVGFYDGALDGLFGPRTVAAIRAAQNHYRLPVTGAPDAALKAALGLGTNDQLLRLIAISLLNHLKGLPQMNFLNGYKTYLVAAAMLITGLAGLLGVDIPSFTGQAPGNLVLEALAFVFLRQGVKTGR